MKAIQHTLLIVFLFISSGLLAQTDNGKYDPHPLFTPSFYPPSVGEYRAPTGEPGAKYWQNRANYEIKAFLDDVKDQITGSVIITYTNNSPYPMSFLWLRLDQNLFNNDSRGH